MSSVSGSAAGQPSGITGASAVVGSAPGAPEPKSPAPKSYSISLVTAQVILYIALLGPAMVGIGMKIQSLIDAGAIADDAAESSIAVLQGVGAASAFIANVVFGRLSDRTTSRWGRRRPWVVGGTALMTVAFGIMATAPNLATATAGWALAQLGANATLAAFIATISDQVPSFQRGSITALLGIAQNVGILGGAYVADFFAGHLLIMFVGPSVVAVIAMLVFALILQDRVLPERPPRLSFRGWISTFWVSPLAHPDYALAWWSRFSIMTAAFMFTTFRFFFIQRELGVPVEETPRVLSTAVLIYTCALVISGWAAGRLSDRLGRRKIFVWSATVAFAIGTAMLGTVTDVQGFYLVEAWLGFAYGVYIGVDLALVVDVLPNPDDAGKDLGVFNMANALPQSLAPVIAGALIYVGSYPNYTLMLGVAGGVALLGALVIFPIRSVR